MFVLADFPCTYHMTTTRMRPIANRQIRPLRPDLLNPLPPFDP